MSLKCLQVLKLAVCPRYSRCLGILTTVVVKKYTNTTQLDATILRESVKQIRVSNTCTTDEQQKQVKIREIETVCHFIGAFDFWGAREQSQTAQNKNNAKAGAA